MSSFENSGTVPVAEDIQIGLRGIYSNSRSFRFRVVLENRLRPEDWRFYRRQSGIGEARKAPFGCACLTSSWPHHRCAIVQTRDVRQPRPADNERPFVVGIAAQELPGPFGFCQPLATGIVGLRASEPLQKVCRGLAQGLHIPIYVRPKPCQIDGR